MDNQINNKEIPIITKTVQLYKMYYKYLELFPKKDKYAMGAVCERYLIEILEVLLQAGYVPRLEKPSFIKTASNKFDMLKIFIRLLRELDIIDQKKYLALQTVIQEIGKMFGGWIKSLSPAK